MGTSSTKLSLAAFSCAAFLLAAGAAFPAQPAPAPDPLARLAQDAEGVLDVDTDPRLMLLEEDHGVLATRVLRPGDLYADGWRLESLKKGTATLRKAAAVRTVEIKGRDQKADEVRVPVPNPNLALSTSNAAVGGSDGSSPEYRARLGQAVAKGDLAQVVRLNGSSADLFASLANKGIRPPPDVQALQVMDMRGKTVLGGYHDDGTPYFVASDEIADLPLPRGAPSLIQPARPAPPPPAFSLPLPEIPAGWLKPGAAR